MSKDAEVNINMDKACTVCGQMGATGSGLCLSCIGDQIAGGPKLTMEAIVSASKQIDALMATHTEQIHRAYLIAGGDGKLSIGLTVELEPSKEVANAIKVTAKINFIESRVKDESVARVSMQQKLPI